MATTQQHVKDTYQDDVDEEEYEYEYSTTETEDFHFTLDLTTHVPHALAPQPPARFGNGNDPITTINPEYTTPSNAPSSSNHLQILDLHTHSPLIKFNNHIYTCHWSTDLGTQFHVSQTGLTPTPLRRGNVLEIISISQTRLLGNPITLNPRSTPNGPPIHPPTSRLPQRKIVPVVPLSGHDDDPPSSDDDSNTPNPFQPPITSKGKPTSDAIIAKPGSPLYIPPSHRTNPIASSQATFLTSLSLLKLAKNEPDQVPVYAVKMYQPPANASALRDAALAEDEANGQDVSVPLMLQRQDGGREARKARVGTGFEAKGRVRKRKGAKSEGEKRGTKREFGMGTGAGRASREVIRASVGFEEDGMGEGEGEWRFAGRDGGRDVEGDVEMGMGAEEDEEGRS